jgi:alcohol dehydrogenase class IV
MDAIIHAVESFVAKSATPMSKMFSKEAFGLLYGNIEKAVNNPEHLGIRGKMLLGSYYAAIGMMNSGLGVAHAMGYPLGTMFNVPHGMAGAVFLPKVVEMNVGNGVDEYAYLVDGIYNKRVFSRDINRLCDWLEIPDNLKGFGVKESDVDALVQDVMTNMINTVNQNPILIGEEDIRKILMEMV